MSSVDGGNLESMSGMQSGMQSGTPSLSQKTQKGTTYVIASKYRWTSNWSYICSLMASVCSLRYFGAFIEFHELNSACIIHYIVAYTLVGLPMHYLQTLLGQYTQTSVYLIKRLSPIGGGLAVTYISNMFLYCVMNGLLLADITIYFLSSMRRELQWMKCAKVVEEWGCWNGTGCNKNCLSLTNKSSAYHYFVRIYMENAQLNPNTTKIIGIPSLSRTVLIASSWVFTCLVLTAVSSIHRKFYVYMWNLSFSLIVFNMLAAVINVPKQALAEYAFRLDADTLLNPQIWAKAFTKPVAYLGLGRAFHILHGSYMSPNTSSGILSAVSIFYSFIVLYTCSIFIRCRLLSLHSIAHLDKEHQKYVWEPGIVTYFINIPLSFGLSSLSHCWSMQYFLLCMCLLLSNQITHIIAFEKILSEHYPALIRYKRYVLGGIALSAGLISVCLSSKETYLVYKSVTSEISQIIEVFNCLMLSILVCYIYGVQKFCDDIHFMRGAQPSNYWKICWYAMPIILIFTYYYLSFKKSAELNVIETIEQWIFFILISPIPIAAVIEALRYIRKRNILGLFQSDDMFGPPDPNERYLRRLFNPRKETRSQRKSEACYHKCLLNNKTLKRVAQEELTYKRV